MILEDCPITILLVYITIQYSTIVIIVLVYDNKCHRTIPQYIMSYSVVHKNVTISSDGQQYYIFVLQYFSMPIGDFILCYLHFRIQYLFVFHSLYVLDL